MNWVLATACAVASLPAGLRWLRVAQREHYLAPAATRFALRWWTVTPANLALLGLSAAGLLGSLWTPWLGFAAVVSQAGPLGFPVRGVSAPLAWTPRLRRLASITGLFTLAAYLGGVLWSAPVVIVLGLVGLPVAVDAAMTVLSPVERLLGGRWVAKAARKLEAVRAEVVAITGSYGKTTTKLYTEHLVSATLRTVASPASFNNRMGLARAINENLVPGTQVFVAEMGTYGPGEIADICRWIPPRVAAMVSIGPVHLERFKTEERILAAKSEILDRAEIGVICVDHPLLSDLARQRKGQMKIIAVSTSGEGRVQVTDEGLFVDGSRLASTPKDVFHANLAVAVGICLALDVDLERIVDRLDELPIAEHRQSVYVSESGFVIIDDTFNSNPAGARRGLRLLAEAGRDGKKVVVTPGMVELGPVQENENRSFAAQAAEMADHLIVVGYTNRRALLAGSTDGRASVTVVDSRAQAVDWVRSNLGAGDAVLYENDLPDHYP